jgi:hypothetical protein
MPIKFVYQSAIYAELGTQMELASAAIMDM